jgi:hypothetical protein
MVSKQFAAHKLFENDKGDTNLEQKVTYGSVAVALLVSPVPVREFCFKEIRSTFW